MISVMGSYAGNIDWSWVKSELLRHERISEGKAAIKKVVAEALKEARSLASPASASITMNAGGISLLTPKISSYLKGAKSLYIYVVTIGARLEKKASLLMSKGEELKGYLLDRIGSLAVESLAEKEEEALRAECGRKGQSVSSRFSPGYCDWPLEEQRKLDGLVDFSKAGVSLTEKCMMVPKKSISAVIGIGPSGLFKKMDAPCVLCDKTDCDYRRGIR